jgi:hypothetical protein
MIRPSLRKRLADPVDPEIRDGGLTTSEVSTEKLVP